MDKKIIYLIILIFNINLLFSAKLDIGSDKIVKVNNTIITAKELDRKYNLFNELPIADGKKPTKKDVLQMIIQQELMKEELKNSKSLVLNEEQYKQAVQQYKDIYKYEMQKKDANFKYTDENFKDYIENEVKITYENFEEQVKNNILMQQYVMKKAEKKLAVVRTKNYSSKADFPIMIPDAQGGMTKITSMDDFYEKNLQQFVVPIHIEVKHIFMSTLDGTNKRLPDSEIEIKRKKITDIYKRLLNGEKFDTLCELYSEDYNSRDVKDENGNYNRGYLGVLLKTDDNYKNIIGEKNFNILFELDQGKFSNVLETNLGFHIFYIQKKKAAGLMTLEDARGQIIEFFRNIEQQKVAQDTLTEVINDLKSKASIYYYDEQYKE